CQDPQAMLVWLRTSGKLSDRKLRLFAVACCRRIWHLLPDERSRTAVEIAERFADGRATLKELDAARLAADVAFFDTAKLDHRTCNVDIPIAAMAALYSCEETPFSVFAEADLLREMFHPFRPSHLDPGWQSPDVVTLAGHIYHDRDFDRMPELASGLEEAGCTDAEL